MDTTAGAEVVGTMVQAVGGGGAASAGYGLGVGGIIATYNPHSSAAALALASTGRCADIYPHQDREQLHMRSS